MRLARFQSDDGQYFAVSSDSRTWFSLEPLNLATTADAIERWSEIDVAVGRRSLPEVAIDEAGLLSPVHRPSKIIAIGLNYQAHIEEAGVETPPSPVAFAKFPNTVHGPFDDVVIDPMLTMEPDYEVELAIILGRRVRGVTKSEALEAVFGYAVANDVSARDHQFADGQWDRSKSFDTFCPIGPWITTADKVPDIQDLRLTATVNGELRQDASTQQMIHGVAYLIHYLSRGMTLEPGDVILSGTPSGVGLAFDPPKYLRDGDVVACAVEGLGEIRNRMTTSGTADLVAASRMRHEA